MPLRKVIDMLRGTVECLFIYFICLAIWRQYLRFTKPELDNIPGPQPRSFWKGKSNLYYEMFSFTRVFLITGSLPDYFNANGWKYHRYLWKTYGPAIKMKGLFGELNTFQIDMLSWMGRTALELIGQSGFGHSFDDLTEDYDEHSYSAAIKKVVPVTFRMSILRVYGLYYIVKLGSAAFRRKLISILPWPAMKEARDIADVLHKTSLEIYQAKKKAILEGNQEVTDQISQGKDILSILMRANMEASEDDRLPEDEIYGQIATFTFAGMDTTSNAIARILWLLSQHKDVQDKLRSELREAMQNAGGELPYDELVALPFMDAICRETMRIHSPVWQLLRKPNKDILLPLSKPIKTVDGGEMNEIFVPKGTTVMCGLLASNMNTEIWGPDAFEWKPERWIEGLPKTVTDAHLPGIYSNLMTFSGGSRACIGFKFSQLEMKTVLATLISKFEFSPTQEIIWRMTNIVTPALAHGDHTKPQMPLMVKLATDSA
ncbi:hypothetical protein CVT24_011976 [Panaeolus cyanescens]|uniref:Cytochrome P450 n=1 Tax=Panaeolus cyanescens TaxID=181874 RepID=A0A409VYZ1_9AGAR|nr:hypothetical protein CVT24_011976 [Panaeolus cyanescens]